jgi:DNA topoisomerase-3
MRLIIAEKPSVSRSIASVTGAAQKRDGYIEGSGYIISWCAGHLLELAAPDAYGEQYAKWNYADLPIVPEKWKYIPSKDKTTQLKILKSLMNRPDVECVVNACDAGREGELIFRLVYEYAMCKKPLKRLWISSMEDAAIKAGFEQLKDGAEYDNLYAAASCRERADWLVGMSATRLFSVLYGTTLNTGRVQSPTLAMLVRRDAEIAAFVKTPFYTVELDCGGFVASSERCGDKTAAGHIMNNCRTAAVTGVSQTQKSIAAPKLYDLTTLQREANRAHGFTAQQTLDYAQSLYEKKLITYPRTDSRYITDDMIEGVMALVSAIVKKTASEESCYILQVVNAAKVTDHHAILPTIEGVGIDLAMLSNDECTILDMLTNRLICAVGDKHRYLETVITLAAGGAEFKAKGKTIIQNGWKSVAGIVPDKQEDAEQSLPDVAEGQTFSVIASIAEGSTSPPKHYTEDTLLSAMENAGAEDMPEDAERKGLGTPATRAAIIERLVRTGFVERNKKNLLATCRGQNLIAVLPETLTSPLLTAEWENKLLEVQRGRLDGSVFMDGIAAYMRSVVEENKTPMPEYISLFADSKKYAHESLGECPRCGSPVREFMKVFLCDKVKCGFKLYRESRFWTAKKKPLTAAIVTGLLKHGRVPLKGLYSEKTGKKYDATVILDDPGDGAVNFKLEFQ